MASNNNVPFNLSLEEEIECGEGIQNQLWLEHAAKKKKAEVTALKAELKERTCANHEQESINKILKGKVQMLQANFAWYNAYWDHGRAQGPSPL